MIKNPPVDTEDGAQSLGWEFPVEEEMATHSSILVWNIPRQRSLAGYYPWGCKELDLTEHICIRLLPFEFKIFSKREE